MNINQIISLVAVSSALIFTSCKKEINENQTIGSQKEYLSNERTLTTEMENALGLTNDLVPINFDEYVSETETRLNAIFGFVPDRVSGLETKTLFKEVVLDERDLLYPLNRKKTTTLLINDIVKTLLDISNSTQAFAIDITPVEVSEDGLRRVLKITIAYLTGVTEIQWGCKFDDAELYGWVESVFILENIINNCQNNELNLIERGPRFFTTVEMVEIEYSEARNDYDVLDAYASKYLYHRNFFVDQDVTGNGDYFGSMWNDMADKYYSDILRLFPPKPVYTTNSCVAHTYVDIQSSNYFRRDPSRPAAEDYDYHSYKIYTGALCSIGY